MDDFVPVTDKRLDIGLFSNEKSNKKKSKLKKKKRPIENYKNIKILKSVYEEDVDDDKNNEKENDKIDKSSTNHTDKEGFELLNQFLPAGWDKLQKNGGGGGGGNFDAEQAIQEAFDIRYFIIDTIDKIHSFIIYCEYNFSYIVTKTLSLGNFIEDDVSIMKKYITWFFTICISSYAVYNWFFISFYRNVINQKVENISSQLNRQKLKELSITNPFLFLSEPYITFSVFFPEMLYKIIVEKIPEFTENNFIPAFSFVLLFYAIIYIFYNLDI